MRPDEFLIIENYRYTECPAPQEEFCSIASLHNHSRYSEENLATLNRVMAMPGMRPLRGIVQRAFGLSGVQALDYRDIHYNPPMTPSEVLGLELESARQMGFEDVLFALTDHNTVRGNPELLTCSFLQQNKIGHGEELSILFQGYVFHLGVVGLPIDRLTTVHNQLQLASRSGRLDELFEILHSIECLVILNHPLLPWDGGGLNPMRAYDFIKKYGWAIHALEFNGMRCLEENEAVLELAREVGKPLLGGGDSHLLTAGTALGASRHAKAIGDYIEEVKEGSAITLIRKHYYSPLGWKVFLRVFSFIAQYRSIAFYQGREIESVLGKRRILLDPIGKIAQFFLNAMARLKLVR